MKPVAPRALAPVGSLGYELYGCVDRNAGRTRRQARNVLMGQPAETLASLSNDLMADPHAMGGKNCRLSRRLDDALS